MMKQRLFLTHLILPIISLFLLGFPSPLGGWGWWQHEVIAEIAEQNLSSSARQRIREILGPNTRFSQVASWADEVRPLRPLTAPWHYINYPLEIDEPDYDVRETPEGNVVWAIEAQIAFLKDPGVRGREREEALKFLVHFLGDLHQPLHCGEEQDHGGNDFPVTWHNRLTNLHHAWDCLIFPGEEGGADSWATYLQAGISPQERAAIIRGSPYDWMVESHILAREVCYDRLGQHPRSFRRSRAPEISGAYASAARPVFRRRLLEAGLRLARVLNEIFGEGAASGDN